MDAMLQAAAANARSKMGMVVKAAFRDLLVTVISDRLFHAEVLGAGSFSWRRAFHKEFGANFDGNRIHCDTLADLAFRFFEVQWRERFLNEASPAYDGLSPKQLLDEVEMKSPVTQQEIDDAWEVEIASDQRAMDVFYEGSARVRKGRDLGERKTPLSQEQIRKIVNGN